MNALRILFKTEMKLAFREFSGMLFGIILPVGLMILLGVLYGDSPAYDGAAYTATQQSFPAVMSIGIIACGLMGMPLSVCGYREKKILKRFKATPTSPAALLGAQVLTQTMFALGSALLVFFVAKLAFGYTMPGSAWAFVGTYTFVMAVSFSIGMLIASVSKTIKTANLIASLIYFPTFFLSGATIPYEIMPRGLQTASDILPLTHGIKLLKSASLNIPLENGILVWTYLGVTLIVCSAVAIRSFRWE